MSKFILTTSISSKNYYSTSNLDDCVQAQAQKLFDLFEGDVKLFEYDSDTGTMIDRPSKLNPQSYSIGKNNKGNYISSVNRFKDVKDTTDINDFESIKVSFHCHPSNSTPAQYVNSYGVK